LKQGWRQPVVASVALAEFKVTISLVRPQSRVRSPGFPLLDIYKTGFTPLMVILFT